MNAEIFAALRQLEKERGIPVDYMVEKTELEAEGHKAVVVEHSVFKNRQTSLAYDADVVIAVLAPIDLRIERAVKSGWDETDVRRRIAQQITDADRIEASDVVFNNDGTPEEMRNKVLAWWGEYSKDL